MVISQQVKPLFSATWKKDTRGGGRLMFLRMFGNAYGMNSDIGNLGCDTV